MERPENRSGSKLNLTPERRFCLGVFVVLAVLQCVSLAFSHNSEKNRRLAVVDATLTASISNISTGLSLVDRLDQMSGPTSIAGYPTLQFQVVGYVVSPASPGDLKPGDSYPVQKGWSHELTETDYSSASARRYSSAGTHYDTFISNKQTTNSVVSKNELNAFIRADIPEFSSGLLRWTLGAALWSLLLVCAATLVSVLLFRTSIQQMVSTYIQSLQQSRRSISSGSLELVPESTFPEISQFTNEILVSEQKAIESESLALEQANTADLAKTRYQELATLGADLFWEVDNRLRFTGFEGEVDSVPASLLENLHGKSAIKAIAEDSESISDIRNLSSALKKQAVWEGELKLRDGSKPNLRLAAYPVMDEQDKFAGARGILVDTTAASTLSKKLEHEASHDQLTGLINRREFDRQLELIFTRYQKEGADGCVCMLDLDRFKQVNDSCGHTAGDMLLQQLAELIRYCVRESDIVARFGGDEFALIFNGCTVDNVLPVAEKLREAIEGYRFHWNGKNYDLGASIGVAAISDDMQTANDVLMAADATCFKAKRMGRNRVELFDPADEEHLAKQGEMVRMNKITDALEDERFELYYQNVVARSDSAAKHPHVEVLLRLYDEGGTLYQPPEFIPVAERYNLMMAIDRAVINRALSWLGEQNPSSREQFTLSMNLSSASCGDRVFHDSLIDSITAASINPEHLCFEMPETAAMQHLRDDNTLLARLEDMGCKIALDNFGCGFSSMNMIKELPLDYLKIDGSFIRGLLDNPLDQSLIRTICEVAGMLEVDTIATQVEEEAIAVLLDSLGVDYIQGFLYSVPAKLTDMDALLASVAGDKAA